MPVTFASPYAPLLMLLLAALLGFVWLVGRRSLAGLDRFRRRVALGLRMAVVTLLVLGLAELEWGDLTDRVEVVFVVDHSRSVPEGQAERVFEAINRAQAGMDAPDDLGKVVVFGRDASTETKLGPDRAPLERVTSLVERDHTNVAAAIRRALESIDPDARGRIVLISDGNETMGEASKAVARARAAHVPVDVVPIEYAYGEEVLVEKIVLPSEVRLGEPFLARVVVNAVAPTRARLNLFRNGAVLETREVDLDAGVNVEQFTITLDDPDFYRIHAVVEPLDRAADELFQNNVAHGFVFVRGEAQVLFVHDPADPDASESAHLLEALSAEKISTRVVSALDFPLESIELQGYDAVVLDDCERPSFSERQQEAIESAVANMGVGLVMIGGERSFGAGEWRGSPVESALPVEMDIKQEEVIPDGALCMIMHSTEMPEGNAMAIKVCKKAVDSLSAKDTVGVLIFGAGGNEWAVRIQKARNKPAIKQRIHNMSIGDMPDFDGIFRMAVNGLKGVDASVKHMILMSDGDPSPPAPALLKQCRENRITVSTICYFAHGGAQGPNVQVMRRIANMTGGKFYYLENANQLPRIFTKESQRVARSLIVNQRFVPTVRADTPLIAGFSGFPAVSGYVLTEAKPRADVPLVSPENAPVLAHWQYGVGKSVAFTSDAKPRWATEWVQWGGYQSFWSQVVRWVSKDVQESYLSVGTAVRGDEGVVMLDAVTPEGEYVEGLQVQARVTSPDGSETHEVQLTQRGPGRYEGEFPLEDVGTYNVHLITSEDGTPRHSVTTGLVSPYSDEFKRLRSNRPYLEEIARQGGGRVVALDDLFPEDPTADPAVDLWDRASLADKIALEERWPLALTLALILFLLDVAVRRVAIDWEKIWGKAVAVVTRKPPDPEQSTMERLRSRKAAVREKTEAPTLQVDPSAPRSVEKFTATGADHGPIDVAGGPAGTGEPAPRPKPQPRASERPEAGQDEPGGTLGRLRRAKRRARGQLGDEDDESSEG